jgi:hypothetical protein
LRAWAKGLLGAILLVLAFLATLYLFAALNRAEAQARNQGFWLVIVSESVPSMEPMWQGWFEAEDRCATAAEAGNRDNPRLRSNPELQPYALTFTCFKRIRRGA